MFIYTFLVHNFPSPISPALSFSRANGKSSKTTVRRATRVDAGPILELVEPYAAQGLMLPRTLQQIAARIDNYVVATDAAGHVLACAALEEYSPSLAEVSSVAVAPSHHGQGLGSQVAIRSQSHRQFLPVAVLRSDDDLPVSRKDGALRYTLQVRSRDRTQALLPEDSREVVDRAAARRAEGRGGQ